jgi:hypothetical protein
VTGSQYADVINDLQVGSWALISGNQWQTTVSVNPNSQTYIGSLSIYCTITTKRNITTDFNLSTLGAKLEWSTGSTYATDKALFLDFITLYGTENVATNQITYTISWDGPSTRIEGDLTLQPIPTSNVYTAGTSFKIHVYNGYQILSPIMTSNNTPSPYVVSASSQYSGSYQPYMAFTRTYDTMGGANSEWESANGQITGWLQIDLGSTSHPALKQYVLCPGHYSNPVCSVPTSWSVQGSIDGTTFTDLDTQTNYTDFSGVQHERKTFTANDTIGYRYYRLNITAITVLRQWNLVSIGDWILLG